MAISEQLMAAAHSVGIKLEMVNGIPVWEASPVIFHQEAVDRIRTSIAPLEITNETDDATCGCFHYPDISLIFPDGSEKRPDISLFCTKPTEITTSVTQAPDAVFEIVSKGYEAKDSEISVPFYLSWNIPDVILFNPYTNNVTYYADGVQFDYVSPVTITLLCGCTCCV